jgi:hypothetical protein
MKNPWRTIALCATCAVLAGAGSAALADTSTPEAKPPVAKTVRAMDPAEEALARKRKCDYAREHKIPQADEVCAGKPDEAGGVAKPCVADDAAGSRKSKEAAPPGDPAIKAPPAAL